MATISNLYCINSNNTIKQCISNTTQTEINKLCTQPYHCSDIGFMYNGSGNDFINCRKSFSTEECIKYVEMQKIIKS